MGTEPGLRSYLTDIDHVGLAVRDLDEAVERYRSAFGIEPVHREHIASDGVNEALFQVGGSFIQLLAPTGPETPVGRYLEKRGEGVHHVGYRVSDLPGTIEALRAAEVPLIDHQPRPGSRGTMVAFVHPKGFRGVLVELVQGPLPGSLPS